MKQLMMRYEGGSVVAPDTDDSLIIRTFTASDRDALAAALMPLTREKYDDARLERDILSHPGVRPEGVFLAEMSGNIVGTATGYTHENDDGGTLHMVSALMEVKRRGVGYAVCAAAVDYLIGLGCSYVDLTTDDFRLAAICVYTRLGFRAVIDDSEMESRWTKVYDDIGMPEMMNEAFYIGGGA